MPPKGSVEMSLINSVRDLLIEAGLPVGPLPAIEALALGVPGEEEEVERMIAVAQTGRHAPILVVFGECLAYDMPAVRATGYAMLADRVAVLAIPELASSVAPARLQEAITLGNLANRMGGSHGAVSWSTSAGTVSVSTVVPFPMGTADAAAVEFLTRAALSADSWVPDFLAILGGREMAVDRIARRIPVLAELVGDAVADQATPDDGADDWGDDEGPVAPFVVDL